MPTEHEAPASQQPYRAPVPSPPRPRGFGPFSPPADFRQYYPGRARPPPQQRPSFQYHYFPAPADRNAPTYVRQAPDDLGPLGLSHTGGSGSQQRSQQHWQQQQQQHYNQMQQQQQQLPFRPPVEYGHLATSSQFNHAFLNTNFDPTPAPTPPPRSPPPAQRPQGTLNDSSWDMSGCHWDTDFGIRGGPRESPGAPNGSPGCRASMRLE